jgi:hypothetical protein
MPNPEWMREIAIKYDRNCSDLLLAAIAEACKRQREERRVFIKEEMTKTIATRFIRDIGPSLENLFRFTRHDDDCAYHHTEFCDCGLKIAKDRMKDSLSQFHDELQVIQDKQ